MQGNLVPELSVVVPVYRSADSLPALVERLRAALDVIGRSYELVLVDDGSPDDSWQVLQQIQAANGDVVTALQLMRNFGQHNALMCGFRHCRGRYIVTLDDDLQNPPEEIIKLLKAIEVEKLDVVYGRYHTKEHALGRNLGSYLVNGFFQTVFHTPVTVSSFRIIRRELIESILSYALNFTYIDGLLAWNTQRIGEVAAEHRARKSGPSGYSVPKLITLALNLVTNFSVLPLQIASGTGFLAALAGFVLGAYYLVQYFSSNIGVPGYASTIVAVLVLGGLQLLSLGLIGEYVGRLHLNVNRKPQYIVRQVLRAAAGAGMPCIQNIVGHDPASLEPQLASDR